MSAQKKIPVSRQLQNIELPCTTSTSLQALYNTKPPQHSFAEFNQRPKMADTPKPKPAAASKLPPELRYIQYSHALEKKYLPSIRALISKDLSEPYSIYVYRYFLYQWDDLCFMVRVLSFTFNCSCSQFQQEKYMLTGTLHTGNRSQNLPPPRSNNLQTRTAPVPLQHLPHHLPWLHRHARRLLVLPKRWHSHHLS